MKTKRISFPFKSLWVFSLGVLLCFFLLSPFTFANAAKKYGPEYFHAIEGEVSGQTAPGVQAVYINGEEVPVDKDLNFTAKVSLKEGQKYLTIETKYKDISFVKKYLVARQPVNNAPFKLVVPRQELAKPSRNKRLLHRRLAKKMPRIKKPLAASSSPARAKTCGFQFVAELERGKMFVVRKFGGKYYGSIYLPKEMRWISLDQLSRQEFTDLLKNSTLP